MTSPLLTIGVWTDETLLYAIRSRRKPDGKEANTATYRRPNEATSPLPKLTELSTRFTRRRTVFHETATSTIATSSIQSTR